LLHGAAELTQRTEKKGTEMKTLTAVYNDIDDARGAIDALVRAGVDRDQISLILNDQDERYAPYVDNGDMEEVGEGAGIGAAFGALGGLLLGLGALAIPGIGPVVAAGPLAGALLGAGAGAVAGGIIGALVELGIPEEEAHIYAESVRRGHALVVAQVAEHRSDEMVRILQRFNMISLTPQVEEWRASGWDRFDAEREPYYERPRM
jgi:hypothetical protein